ncbi:uncharacterized protein MELLADRAFT_94444 [Melampsora larici-populina 98AG31]|uniref:Uncharacterized protein n=1 Tax=Melampsora larici-populina (strain 98AG31 / pathotype 3-4-7) TaxID=747676 RepID=F4RB45_MELLP|nr:uncharacterized protein MELLADRAFT_94444 [Melampsora larici-populina 98AG31]EGG10095.1 hypothetical protein MELLADRAFT_94444 [Melampsora larici-populina 98AG31]
MNSIRQKLKSELQSFNAQAEERLRNLSFWNGKQEAELSRLNNTLVQLEAKSHDEQTHFVKTDQLTETVSSLKQSDETLGQEILASKETCGARFQRVCVRIDALEELIGRSDEKIANLHTLVQKDKDVFGYELKRLQEHNTTSMTNHCSVIQKLGELDKQIANIRAIHDSSENTLSGRKDGTVSKHTELQEELLGPLHQKINALEALINNNPNQLTTTHAVQSLGVPDVIFVAKLQEELLSPLDQKIQALECLFNNNSNQITTTHTVQSLGVPDIEELLSPLHQKIQALESLTDKNSHQIISAQAVQSLGVPDVIYVIVAKLQEELLSPVHQKIRALESLVNSNSNQITTTPAVQSLVVPDLIYTCVAKLQEELLSPLHQKIQALESLTDKNSHQIISAQAVQSLGVPDVEELLSPVHQKIQALESLVNSNSNQITTTPVVQSTVVPDVEELLIPLHQKTRALESLINQITVTHPCRRIGVPNFEELLTPLHQKIQSLESFINNNSNQSTNTRSSSLSVSNIDTSIEIQTPTQPNPLDSAHSNIIRDSPSGDLLMRSPSSDSSTGTCVPGNPVSRRQKSEGYLPSQALQQMQVTLLEFNIDQESAPDKAFLTPILDTAEECLQVQILLSMMLQGLINGESWKFELDANSGTIVKE